MTECYPYRTKYMSERQKRLQNKWFKIVKIIPEGVKLIELTIVVFLVFLILQIL